MTVRFGAAPSAAAPSIDVAVELDPTTVEAMELSSRLEALVRSDAVRVVAVADPVTLDRAYSGWVAELKRNRASLVLQPGASTEVEAITGTKAPLRPGQAFAAGRGVLVDHGRPTLIQVAWAGS